MLMSVRESISVCAPGRSFSPVDVPDRAVGRAEKASSFPFTDEETTVQGGRSHTSKWRSQDLTKGYVPVLTGLLRYHQHTRNGTSLKCEI